METNVKTTTTPIHGSLLFAKCVGCGHEIPRLWLIQHATRCRLTSLGQQHQHRDPFWALLALPLGLVVAAIIKVLA